MALRLSLLYSLHLQNVSVRYSRLSTYPVKLRILSIYPSLFQDSLPTNYSSHIQDLNVIHFHILTYSSQVQDTCIWQSFISNLLPNFQDKCERYFHLSTYSSHVQDLTCISPIKLSFHVTKTFRYKKFTFLFFTTLNWKGQKSREILV